MIHNLKPYPSYKDSGVPWLGEIPSHWEMRRNGRLLTQRNEPGFPDLPILEVSLKTGVSVRSFEASSRKQVMTDRDKYKRACCGDIAYNMMRMWQGAVGVPNVDGLVSPAYVVARPLPGTAARYFTSLFRTPGYMTEVNNYSRGIVPDRNRLYWEDFKQLASPCPPYEEQSAIVQFLAYADRRIQRYIRVKKTLIALLNEQKQAIIHRAVTRGIDPNVRLKPSGMEWPGDIPEHWEIWQIGHFGRVGNGSTPSRGNAGYWNGGTYPWLNSSSVNRGRITNADQFVTNNALHECHLPRVQPGSVLVAITGQGKTRGTAAILDIEATINQHLAFITPYRAVIDPEYLLLSFIGAYRELRTISDDSGSTKGALTCGDIAHFKIALPPLNEQALIASEVRRRTQSLEEALTRTERQIDLIQEYRTSLIADVVTGKLDVRDEAARLPDEAEELGSLYGDETLEAGEEGDIAELDAAEESET